MGNTRHVSDSRLTFFPVYAFLPKLNLLNQTWTTHLPRTVASPGWTLRAAGASPPSSLDLKGVHVATPRGASEEESQGHVLGGKVLIGKLAFC